MKYKHSKWNPNFPPISTALDAAAKRLRMLYLKDSIRMLQSQGVKFTISTRKKEGKQ